MDSAITLNLRDHSMQRKLIAAGWMQAPKWIDVNDRVSDFDELVIVLDSSEGAYRPGFGQLRHRDAQGYAWSISSLPTVPYTRDIVAWLPLSALPNYDPDAEQNED